MTDSFRRARLGAAAVALLLRASPAHAQGASDAAIAEKLFLEGRTLMGRGEYAEACPKLAESQRIDPGVGTLLNLGECYEKQGKTASAWATYREAEPAARRAGQKERAQHATARAEALAATLAYLTVRVPTHPQGLVVTLDEKPVAEATWGTAIPVDPGKHLVKASAPGRAAWRSTIDVAPRARAAAEIPELERVPIATATLTEPPAEPPRDPSAGTRRTIGWASVIVGGVALGTSVVFGAIAKSKNDEARADHCSSLDCDSRGVSLIGDAKSGALVSTIFFAVGAAAVAGGVVLVVTAPGGRHVAIGPTGVGGTW